MSVIKYPYEDRLLAKFIEAGHKPILGENGEPDFVAYSDDDEEGLNHAGLQCSKCYYGICSTCWLRNEKLEPCDS